MSDRFDDLIAALDAPRPMDPAFRSTLERVLIDAANGAAEGDRWTIDAPRRMPDATRARIEAALTQRRGPSQTRIIAAASGSGGTGQAFSPTNIQEQGVDEPDIVKTDGRRLAVLNGGTRLSLLDVTSGHATLRSSMSLPGARGIFLSGDRVMVVTSLY